MTLLKNDQTSYDKTKVVVIIATYNGSKYIVNCIQSILEGYIIPQIIMIDNNSSDATIELVRKTFQEIKIIKLSQNQGFGFANNVGISYAIKEFNANYFFLINQDTVVNINTLDNLLKSAYKHPEFGIISPLHLNDNYALDVNFENYIKPFDSNFITFPDDMVREVSMINAAAWLVNRNCVNLVGGFDTSMFFHYGEDDNYCQRVVYHGFKIGFIVNSSIIHFRSNKAKVVDPIKALGIIMLRKRTEMADILISDDLAKRQLSNYLKTVLLIFVKSILTLNFHKSSYLIQELIRGNIFIKSKLMKSRIVNRSKGLNWLNQAI